MKSTIAGLLFVILTTLSPIQLRAESIDGRVIQTKLWQDITLYYLESRGGFTVELRTQYASVQGQKLYIGDGDIALELSAHPTKGIFLQGESLKQGDEIKKNAKIKVKPGFKRASELSPGDVYVTLPAVIFELPAKP